ncbi:hypothetical protein D3C85_1159690 [compost metagenome]
MVFKGILISPIAMQLVTANVLGLKLPFAIIAPLSSFAVQESFAFSIGALPKCATSTAASRVSALVNTNFETFNKGTVLLEKRLNSLAVIYPFSSQKASKTPTSAVPCPG